MSLIGGIIGVGRRDERGLKFNIFSVMSFLNGPLPKLWKDCILNCRGNLMNFCIFNHHLIKKKQLTLFEQVGK